MPIASRITHRSVTTTAMHGLQSNLGRLQQLQEQLSSGKQVNRPSDSPVKTVESMQFRAGIRRTEQYVRNIDDGLSLLGTTDAALTRAVDLTQRARELVVQGISDANNEQGRKALAAEIRTLRDGVISMANTRYLDRPVFAGNASSSSAFDEATGAYQGDASEVVRTVSPGTKVAVNVVGTQAFGADGSPDQLFTVLDRLATALETQGPTMYSDLNDGLAKLDVALDRVINTLGQVGARFNRLEAVRSTAEEQLIGLADNLAETESIDLPKTIVDLQMQEVAYKAALGATARAVQPSLLDFLR